MNQLLMRLPLNGEGTRTMDHVDRYRRRFRAIDNGYTHELAVKKKKDLRRMVMEDGPEEKRAAMSQVEDWGLWRKAEMMAMAYIARMTASPRNARGRFHFIKRDTSLSA